MSTQTQSAPEHADAHNRCSRARLRLAHLHETMRTFQHRSATSCVACTETVQKSQQRQPCTSLGYVYLSTQISHLCQRHADDPKQCSRVLARLARSTQSLDECCIRIVIWLETHCRHPLEDSPQLPQIASLGPTSSHPVEAPRVWLQQSIGWKCMV